MAEKNKKYYDSLILSISFQGKEKAERELRELRQDFRERFGFWLYLRYRVRTENEKIVAHLPSWALDWMFSSERRIWIEKHRAIILKYRLTKTLS